jgi:hypothetical protein
VPAPQFHLTFGLSIAERADAPAEMRAAVAAEPVYARLGAIVHDLPYYGNMLAETVRYGLRGVALDEPWAYRMHSVRPGAFVACFIRAAATVEGLSRNERLALVAGILSHCALDLGLHPLVNHVARREVDEHGGHESTHHRMTEKYHALFFHLDRHGSDPIGSPGFRELTRVTKAGGVVRARVEPPIAALIDAAYHGAYAAAPSPAQWARWVRSFAHFGLLVATPWAARNSAKKRRDPSLRVRYFENDGFSFWDFYAAAERELRQLLPLGLALFDGACDSDAFMRSTCIDDLAEPAPRPGAPPMPISLVRCPPGMSRPASRDAFARADHIAADRSAPRCAH